MIYFPHSIFKASLAKLFQVDVPAYTAINFLTAISAMVNDKLTINYHLYPDEKPILFTHLIGQPSIGKSKTIYQTKKMLTDIPNNLNYFDENNCPLDEESLAHIFEGEIVKVDKAKVPMKMWGCFSTIYASTIAQMASTKLSDSIIYSRTLFVFPDVHLQLEDDNSQISYGGLKAIIQQINEQLELIEAGTTVSVGLTKTSQKLADDYFNVLYNGQYLGISIFKAMPYLIRLSLILQILEDYKAGIDWSNFHIKADAIKNAYPLIQYFHFASNLVLWQTAAPALKNLAK